MSEHFIRLPRLTDYVDLWAARLPSRPAMIQHEDGKTVSYPRFRTLIDFFALRLLSMGIGPGDRVASLLVLIPEHMALMYACFRIGMTENAGFATFTPPGTTPEEMVGQVGRAFADLAEVTIRKPMQPDGSAGAALPDGEIGEICYHPPIVFAGYYNLPEETAKAVSREGILYTGDLGKFEDKGTYRALYLSGRRKFMIEQKGYNVFPDEVEDHIARMDGVAAAEVVGMPHEVFDERIFAFVQPAPSAAGTEEAVMAHCKEIAAYKRPQHVAICPAGDAFPLTRSAKVNKLALQDRAGELIAQLRRNGGWDRH